MPHPRTRVLGPPQNHTRTMNAPITRIRSERLLTSCLPAFETRYLGSEPFVLSRMISTPEFCFGWSHFEGLLESADAEARLVREASETQSKAGSKEQLGLSVVISGAERFCPVLRSFARSVQEQLGAGRVQVSASAHVRRTGDRSRAEGPTARVLQEAERTLADAPRERGIRRAFEMCSERSHRDAWRTSEGPAFFVQSQGTRRHYFRPNTLLTDQGMPDDDLDAHRFETSRLWMAQLSEGDVLYLPRGWWHRHEASSDSLSLVMTAQREAANYGMIVA